MRFSANPTGCNIADSPLKKATKIWNLLSHPFDPHQHCSFGSGVFEVCTWQSHLHLMSFRLLPFCCAKHLSQLSLIWWGHAVTSDPVSSKWNHLTKKWVERVFCLFMDIWYLQMCSKFYRFLLFFFFARLTLDWKGGNKQIPRESKIFQK